MTRTLLIASSLLLITSISNTSDGALLISNSGTGGFQSGAFVGDANTLGFKFTVGAQPLTVTSLGFFDTNSDGLISAITVGIWHTSSESMLTSAVIPSGTSPTLINDYRYTALDRSVLLLPNQSYAVGYRSTNGGAMHDGRFRVGQVIASEVDIPTGGFGLRHSFNSEPLSTDFATQMPALNLGDTVPLTGPNMEFVIGPEPVSVAAFVMPLALSLRRRRSER